jgi:hypothetical protein
MEVKEGFLSGDDIMFGLIVTVLVYIAVIAFAATATKHFAPQKSIEPQ